jgi:hypothetical protein
MIPALPANGEVLFVKIDVRPNLLGKLLDFVFKPPPVILSLAFADGQEERFRLIPAQAREGMILSPKILSSFDYMLVEQSEDIGNVMRWPTGLRIDLNSFGRIAYQSQVAISTQRIDRAGLNAARDSGLATIVPRLAEILPLLENNRLNPPFVELSGQGVFAPTASCACLPARRAASNLHLACARAITRHSLIPTASASRFRSRARPAQSSNGA